MGLDGSIIERVAAVNAAAIWSEVSLEEREAAMIVRYHTSCRRPLTVLLLNFLPNYHVGG